MTANDIAILALSCIIGALLPVIWLLFSLRKLDNKFNEEMCQLRTNHLEKWIKADYDFFIKESKKDRNHSHEMRIKILTNIGENNLILMKKIKELEQQIYDLKKKGEKNAKN